MQFTVNAATDIVLNCFAGAGGAAGAAVARLTDVTTSQFLFQCPLSPVLPGNSGTVSLNTTDTYTLSTFALGRDPSSASLSFSGDFSIFVPEPSTLWLLGMALMALGLVRKRLEKGKERTSPMVGQPVR